jgi:hypothetical protein
MSPAVKHFGQRDKMRTDNKNEGRHKPFRVADILRNIRRQKNGNALTNIDDIKNALPFLLSGVSTTAACASRLRRYCRKAVINKASPRPTIKAHITAACAKLLIAQASSQPDPKTEKIMAPTAAPARDADCFSIIFILLKRQRMPA